MAIAINGSSNTITGIAVGGLPDGIVDTDMLAANAVTAPKIGSKTFTSYAIIADVKSGGNAGGTFTSGAWRTRDLNTEIADDDGIVSISSNQFTLQAGSYRISASACAHRAGRHQLALYNVTDTSFVQKGINSYAAGGDVVTNAILLSKFTITGAKVFEIQHRTQSTDNDEGLGINIQTGNSSGWNTDEVYCLVEIFKEA